MFERDSSRKIIKGIAINSSYILAGPRQVGKTTLALAVGAIITKEKTTIYPRIKSLQQAHNSALR